MELESSQQHLKCRAGVDTLTPCVWLQPLTVVSGCNQIKSKILASKRVFYYHTITLNTTTICADADINHKKTL